jgi:NAD(P)-dependent dehydrogenase (short-subunit alcohol dehydrogenase family)
MLDLASQASVRQAATHVSVLTDKIDVLINCAGINVKTRRLSPEGIELQFATNHAGHFLLTVVLLPLIEHAAESGVPGATRIVNVSSAGHAISPMRFSDFNFEPGRLVSPDELPRRKEHLPAVSILHPLTLLLHHGIRSGCQS